MAETVKMHCELQFSSFIDPYKISQITTSRSFMNGEWRAKTTLQDFKNGIDKFVLPVDVTQFRICVVTTVASGRLIKRHRHVDEPMFRYLISGSFVLNGESYQSGEWVIVPQGMEYEIYSYEGYTTLAGYGMSCECSAAGGTNEKTFKYSSIE